MRYRGVTCRAPEANGTNGMYLAAPENAVSLSIDIEHENSDASLDTVGPLLDRLDALLRFPVHQLLYPAVDLVNLLL